MEKFNFASTFLLTTWTVPLDLKNLISFQCQTADQSKISKFLSFSRRNHQLVERDKHQKLLPPPLIKFHPPCHSPSWSVFVQSHDKSLSVLRRLSLVTHYISAPLRGLCGFNLKLEQEVVGEKRSSDRTEKSSENPSNWLKSNSISPQSTLRELCVSFSRVRSNKDWFQSSNSLDPADASQDRPIALWLCCMNRIYLYTEERNWRNEDEIEQQQKLSHHRERVQIDTESEEFSRLRQSGPSSSLRVSHFPQARRLPPPLWGWRERHTWDMKNWRKKK